MSDTANRYCRILPISICTMCAIIIASCEQHENRKTAHLLNAPPENKQAAKTSDYSREMVACISYLFPGNELDAILIDRSYEIASEDLSIALTELPKYASLIKGLIPGWKPDVVQWSRQPWLKMRVIESFEVGADNSGVFPVTPEPSYRMSLSVPINLSPSVCLICATVTNGQTRFMTVAIILERGETVRVVQCKTLHFA